MKLKLMIIALFCVAIFAHAGVLQEDDFESGSLDPNVYPQSGGKIGDVSQEGGKLILKGNSTGEWFPRIGTKDSFPDNIQVEAEVTVVDGASHGGNAEANTGFRTGCSGFDSNGTTAELFTIVGGVASPDQIRSRLGGPWTLYGQQDLSSDITDGQTVILTHTLNATTGSNEITVVDKSSGTTLATLNATPAGAPVGGSLMIQSYLMTESAYEYVKITDNGGAGSVIFEDDFEGPDIDPSKWLTYPALVAFTTVTDGAAVINGDDPSNGAGDFAWLPTADTFSDFDLQAVFEMRDLNSGAGAREPDDWFSVRFREVSSNEAYYELAVWPNPGSVDLNGMIISTPAIALRKRTGTDEFGQAVFEYIDDPQSLDFSISPEDTVVLNLQADGDSIMGFAGTDTETGLWPVVSGTDPDIDSGVVNFGSFGIVGVALDEYTIWDAGTGDLPEAPEGPSAADSAWNLYE